MTCHHQRLARTASGFTLTELAVVVVIIAIMIGGMLVPLAMQEDIRRTQESQKVMGDVRDALLGFAVANGRLPCPATATSDGYESFCVEATGLPYTNCTVISPAGPTVFPPIPGQQYRCSNPYDGFVPAATLGIGPVSSQKLLIDAWGSPLRYAVTAQSNAFYDFTTPDGLRNRGLATLASAGNQPDLAVCDSSAGISGAGTVAAACSPGLLTNNAAAVIYSIGRNGSDIGGTSLDERHNPNPFATVFPDRVFVSHAPTPPDAANGEFDDLVIWLSPNILYNRMIAAGRLP
jgi:prepilin-type N-terminal cleavage/methylation domain-containing protein